MKLIKIALFITVGLFSTACTDSKYAKMSDTELAKKHRHCKSIPKKSTVFATGCENIRKEIERRKKKKK